MRGHPTAGLQQRKGTQRSSPSAAAAVPPRGTRTISRRKCKHNHVLQASFANKTDLQKVIAQTASSFQQRGVVEGAEEIGPGSCLPGRAATVRPQSSLPRQWRRRRNSLVTSKHVHNKKKINVCLASTSDNAYPKPSVAVSAT